MGKTFVINIFPLLESTQTLFKAFIGRKREVHILMLSTLFSITLCLLEIIFKYMHKNEKNTRTLGSIEVDTGHKGNRC